MESIADFLAPGQPDKGYSMIGASYLSETADIPFDAARDLYPAYLRKTAGVDYNLAESTTSLFLPDGLPEPSGQVLGTEEIAKSLASTNIEDSFKQSLMRNRMLLDQGMQFNSIGDGPGDIDRYYQEELMVGEEISYNQFQENNQQALFEREDRRLNRLNQRLDGLNAQTSTSQTWSKTWDEWQAKKTDSQGLPLNVMEDMAGRITQLSKVSDLDSLIEQTRGFGRQYYSGYMGAPVSYEDFAYQSGSLVSTVPYEGMSLAGSTSDKGSVSPFLQLSTSFSSHAGDIKTKAIANGDSETMAHMKGWIGGLVMATTEAGVGGIVEGTQILTDKISQAEAGIDTLTDILKEEITDKVAMRVFGDKTPRTNTGEIDYPEMAQRFIDLSNDMAAMSLFAASSAIGAGKQLIDNQQGFINEASAITARDGMGLVMMNGMQTMPFQDFKPAKISEVLVPTAEKTADLAIRYGKTYYTNFITSKTKPSGMGIEELGLQDERAFDKALRVIQEMEDNGVLFRDRVEDTDITNVNMLPDRGNVFQKLYDEYRAVGREALETGRGLDLRVPPAEDPLEMTVDVAGNLSAFVSDLFLFRGAIGSMGPTAYVMTPKGPAMHQMVNPLVWEAQSLASGGKPGEGMAMSGTLSLLKSTGPVKGTLLTSGLFTVKTKMEGGSNADAMVSAAIPIILGILPLRKDIANRKLNKNEITKAIRQFRLAFDKRKVDMSKVSDAQIKKLLSGIQQLTALDKKLSQGKITKENYDKLFGETLDKILPITKGIESEASVKKIKGTTTPASVDEAIQGKTPAVKTPSAPSEPSKPKTPAVVPPKVERASTASELEEVGPTEITHPETGERLFLGIEDIKLSDAIKSLVTTEGEEPEQVKEALTKLVQTVETEGAEAPDIDGRVSIRETGDGEYQLVSTTDGEPITDDVFKDAGEAFDFFVNTLNTALDTLKEEPVTPEETTEAAPELPSRTVYDDTPVEMLIQQVTDGAFVAILDPGDTYSVYNTETGERVSTDLTEQQVRDEFAAHIPVTVHIDETSSAELIAQNRPIALTEMITEKMSSRQQEELAKATKALSDSRTPDFAIEHLRDIVESLNLGSDERKVVEHLTSFIGTEPEKREVVAFIAALAEAQKYQTARELLDGIHTFATGKGKGKTLSDGWNTVNKALASLLDKYLTGEGEVAKGISDINGYLKWLRGELERDYSTDFANSLVPLEMTAPLVDILSNPIEDLSAREVEDLNQVLLKVVHLAEQFDKSIAHRSSQERNDYIQNRIDAIVASELAADVKEDEALADLQKIQGMKPEKKKPGSKGLSARTLEKTWDLLFGIDNTSFVELTEWIWGQDWIDTDGTLHRNTVLENTIDARQKVNETFLEYYKHLEAIKAKLHGLGTWLGPTIMKLKSGLGMKTPTKASPEIGGKEHEFTAAELVSLVLHTRFQQNRLVLLSNGIQTGSGKSTRVSPEELDSLVHALEENFPQLTKFAEEVEAIYIHIARQMNAISMATSGDLAAPDGNYFNIEYAPTSGVPGQYTRPSILDDTGSLKGKETNKEAVLIRDVFELLTEDMGMAANYIGLAENIRRDRMLVNHEAFIRAMHEAGASKILSQLQQRMKNMQRMQFGKFYTEGATGKVEKVGVFLSQKIQQAVLANPEIWVVQPFSAYLYDVESSVKYQRIRTTAGIAKPITAWEKDFFREHWPLYSVREKGIGSLRSIYTQAATRRMHLGKGTFIDEILTLLHKADMHGIGLGGVRTIDEMKDLNLSGKTKRWWDAHGVVPSSIPQTVYDPVAKTHIMNPEYVKWFNKRASYLVTVNQPMFFPENKTSITGATNPLVRVFFGMFRGFVDPMIGTLRRQVIRYKQGSIGKSELAKNVGTVMALVIAMPLFAKLSYKRWVRGDQKAFDDLHAKIISEYFGFGVFVGYPTKVVVHTLLSGEASGKVEPTTLLHATTGDWGEGVLDLAKAYNFYTGNDRIIQQGEGKGQRASTFYATRGTWRVIRATAMMAGLNLDQVPFIPGNKYYHAEGGKQ
jgi:hypothetical protein